MGVGNDFVQFERPNLNYYSKLLLHPTVALTFGAQIMHQIQLDEELDVREQAE